jgi:hypothetical protein
MVDWLEVQFLIFSTSTMANAGGKLDGRLDQEDDDDIPSAAECARRCKEFVDLTKTDSALAQSFLQDRQWSVEVPLIHSVLLLFQLLTLSLESSR